MDECLRRSRQLGAHTLGLHTTELMAVARGMYERMGFLRVPEYDFHPLCTNSDGTLTSGASLWYSSNSLHREDHLTT